MQTPQYLHEFIGSLGRAIGNDLMAVESVATDAGVVTTLTCRMPPDATTVKMIVLLAKSYDHRLRIKRAGRQLVVTRS